MSFSNSFTCCQFPEMSDSSAGDTEDNRVLKSHWNQFLHQLLLMIVLVRISLVSWELLGTTQAPHSHAMARVTMTQQWQAARDCTTWFSSATKHSPAFSLMCTLSCHTTQYHILVSAMVPALLLFGATKLC